MAELKTYFPEQADTSIISYSFVDILEGVGYVNFYPCAFKLSGATTYGMAQSTGIVSGEVVKKLTGAAPADTDVDYDLEFNLSQRIRGNVILSCSVGSAYAGSDGLCFIRASLYKYDGSTETQLGSSFTSNQAVSTASDTLNTIRVLGKFDLSDQTYNFKKGDILRLSIYCHSAGGGLQEAPAAMEQTPRQMQTIQQEERRL